MTLFIPNPKFAQEMDDENTAVLEARAKAAATAAVKIAGEFSGTGAYSRSIKSEGTRVYTTDFAGHLIEWGSAKNPPYAPLRRAAEQVGARVVDDGGQ